MVVSGKSGRVVANLVVGGLLLSGGSGGRLDPRSLPLDGEFFATIW